MTFKRKVPIFKKVAEDTLEVKTQDDFKVQVSPQKEIKAPEYVMRFKDGGVVSFEFERGPKKIEIQGHWRREVQEKVNITPRFSEQLPLGSVIHLKGRYYEIVKPLGPAKVEERYGGAVYVDLVPLDRVAQLKKAGYKVYDEEKGNLPLSVGSRLEFYAK